ncbi:MAG: hypothetical protein JXA74_09130 [Anaerolineae bacterium]|nr:hypothetical protein [Anaerolineae bacterium]
MKEALQEIMGWANRGTLHQFALEAAARLDDDTYQVEREGDKLTIHRLEKRGGVLGIGAETVRVPVLEFYTQGEVVEIREETADGEFVTEFAGLLTGH